MKCHQDGCCYPLGSRLIDTGKGFKPLYTIQMNSGPSAETRFFGVVYKKSQSDRGLLINFCPFCGGRPGYFRIDTASFNAGVKP
jgi:hypothetical protein